MYKTILPLLSTYRSELMGVATIMVMIFHTASPSIYPFGFEISPLKRGDLGVDFFLVLSAIGCYFSLSKKPTDVSGFYWRRFIRIIPTFVVCALIYSIVLFFTENRSLFSFWEYVSMYALLRGDVSFWYIGCILVCYLMFPFLYRLSCKMTVYYMFATIFTIVMFGLAYMRVGDTVYMYRFPIFLISVPIGKSIVEYTGNWGGQISKTLFLLLTVIAFICYMATTIVAKDFFGKYLSYLIVCIPIILWLAVLMTFLPSIILRVLSFIGSISLEVYLLHGPTTNRIVLLFTHKTIVLFICSSAIAIVFGYIMHISMNCVTNALNNMK